MDPDIPQTPTANDLALIYSPHIPLRVQLPQIFHRIALLSAFSPSAFLPASSSSSTTGPHILEIGCGQGDTTVSLLARVGQGGHVTAIDPGSLDYGSPLTLGQAQGLVRKWAEETHGVGTVKFERADAVEFVKRRRRRGEEQQQQRGIGSGKEFDKAVLAKCLWYFPSREAVRETLEAAGRVARRVCVAEYALGSVEAGGMAHVEASEAQGLLYRAITTTGLKSEVVDAEAEGFLSAGSNLRVLLTRQDIKALAGDVGLRLVHEGMVESSRQEDLQDGTWDSGQVVLGDGFLRRVAVVEAYLGGDVAKRMELCAKARKARDRAVEEVVKLGGQAGTPEERLARGLKQVRAMDVWVGEFEMI